MTQLYTTIILVFSIAYTNISLAAQAHHSKYTGQEKRIIKSLSADDIEQLQKGKRKPPNSTVCPGHHTSCR